MIPRGADNRLVKSSNSNCSPMFQHNKESIFDNPVLSDAKNRKKEIQEF